MTMLDAANDFLMSGGGKTASFPEVGTTVRGTVLSAEPRQQADFDTGKPKFWDDGKPMMELVVSIQTTEQDPDDDTDDGVRKLYAKANMLKAIKEAVRPHGGLAMGGELAVKYIGDGEQKKRGFSPPKLYKAQYQPPAKVVSLEDNGDLF